MVGRIVRWAALVLVCGGVIAGIVLAMRPQPVPVDVALVAEGPMSLTVDEEGKTRIRERYVVSSPLVGRLRRISLDAGDEVNAEQTILAVIEPTDPDLLDARALAEADARVLAAEAAVRHAGANLEGVRAAYDFAEDELARVTAAFDQGAGSPRELEEARTDDRIAAEDFRAAQFAEEIARYELEVARSALLYAQGATEVDDRARMEVRSPIDGVVLRVFQESVAVVLPGTPLLEVGDPHDLEMVIDVLSSDAVQINPGDRVIVEHWGGDTAIEGRVRLVEPSAFTKVSALGIEEQRVNIIADLVTPADERSTLGDGFRVEAAIVIWEAENVRQIPTSAVFRGPDGWVVFVVKNDVAQVRNIEIGRQNGQYTQVLDGVTLGEQVVVHPNDQLEAGVGVEVREGE